MNVAKLAGLMIAAGVLCGNAQAAEPVSYTHLTLPTNREV